MNYQERMERADKFTRMMRTTTTYLRKTRMWLYNDPPNVTEYWSLLDEVLTTANEIVERLDDSFFSSEETEDYFGLRASLREAIGLSGPLADHSMSDGPLEATQKLLATIEKRRSRMGQLIQIKRLEAVEGRTPEEKELYLAKAAELRERHGLVSNG